MNEHDEPRDRDRGRDRERDERDDDIDDRRERKPWDPQPHEEADRPRRRRPRRHEPADLGDDPTMRMLLPVGQSGWAIASGYLGLISVLCLPSPLALITGILAVREIKRNPKKHGMGRAIFGIVMGSIGTVFLVLGLIGFVAGALAKR